MVSPEKIARQIYDIYLGKDIDPAINHSIEWQYNYPALAAFGLEDANLPEYAVVFDPPLTTIKLTNFFIYLPFLVLSIFIGYQLLNSKR